MRNLTSLYLLTEFTVDLHIIVCNFALSKKFVGFEFNEKVCQNWHTLYKKLNNFYWRVKMLCEVRKLEKSSIIKFFKFMKKNWFEKIHVFNYAQRIII